MTLRIFVSEFLIGGASLGSVVSASMRHEGLSMLQAVAEDISRLPGCSVITTLEAGTPFPDNVEVIFVENAAHETSVFHRLLQDIDAVLIIAPETNGALLERCRSVAAAGVATWNCSTTAIELCGDKLRLAEHLQSSGIPTIPTEIIDLSMIPSRDVWPVVLKPRDGAGSHMTFLVQNQNEWHHAQKFFDDDGTVEECIVQPFIGGLALSVGVNVSFDGKRTECLPPAEQQLSNDGRFRYLGGTIPADIAAEARHRIEALVRKACGTIPGLAGYVGIDLILTHAGDPLIVEINPRLSTSYVGYRQLYSGLLPERWINSSDTRIVPKWNPGRIEFHVENEGLASRRV